MPARAMLTLRNVQRDIFAFFFFSRRRRSDVASYVNDIFRRC